MGGQQSQATGSRSAGEASENNSTTQANQHRIISTYKRLCADSQVLDPLADGKQISHGAFLKYFGGLGDDFGQLLLKFYTASEDSGLESGTVSSSGAGSRSGISQDEFLRQSNTICGLSGITQLQEFYLRLFNPSEDDFSKDGAQVLLCACCVSAMVNAGQAPLAENDITAAMLKTMFGREEKISSYQVKSFCSRNCPQLFADLHDWLLTHLLEPQQSSAQVAETVGACSGGRGIVPSSVAWALSMILSITYIPSGMVELASTEENKTRAKASRLGLLLSESGPWTKLYDSHTDGLSMNRFKHHVFDYKAPTLMLLEYTDKLFCLACDQEWRDSSERWGGGECLLLQLKPEFKIMLSGASMVYLNMTNRNVPKCIQFGKDTRSLILQIDGDLEKVKEYGIEKPIDRLQVLGCGGAGTREAQLEQKQWESREAQRSKDRKLKLDDWEDSADRQILEMGGVKTQHAER